MSDYTIVTDAEAAMVKMSRRTSEPSERTLALRDGKMIFIPGDAGAAQRASFYGAIPKSLGLSIHTRVGEHEDVKGFFVWTTPKGK